MKKEPWILCDDTEDFTELTEEEKLYYKKKYKEEFGEEIDLH